jgi:hypothetical protein
LDIEAAVRELYALAPEEFTARRTELAAEAREHGSRDLAAEISKLRRPALAAWLVNRLVREHPTEVEQLEGLAQQLRAAHRQLAGDQLRELSIQRQAKLTALTEQVRSEAASDGKTVADSVLRQFRETLEAAIADEDAEQAVLSGQLTTALYYTGFGGIDLTDAVAVPGTPRHLRVVPAPTAKPAARPAAGEPDGDDGAAERRRREQAEAALGLAKSLADEARRDSVSATSAHQRAEQLHTEAASRVEALAAQLAQATAEAAEAKDALSAAREKRQFAEQRQAQAELLLDAARKPLT